MSPEVRSALLAVQPFNRPRPDGLSMHDHSMIQLKSFHNADKHRTMTVAVSAIEFTSTRAVTAKDRSPFPLGIPRTTSDHAFADGVVIHQGPERPIFDVFGSVTVCTSVDSDLGAPVRVVPEFFVALLNEVEEFVFPALEPFLL